MMIRSEQETDNFSKEESKKTSHDIGHDHEDTKNKGTTSITTTTTSSWSRLKDPRIVRVSKAFGGKDRHSKVCTVRGLRDRRVRLSVPTAIQLYDLQERLGLNQPSKVVDWLLNAAKHEIDELPPLQIPPGTFSTLADFDQPKHAGLTRVSGENSTDQEEEIRQFNLQENNAFVTTSGTTTSSNSSTSVSNLMKNKQFIRWDPSNLTLSSSSSGTAHRNDQDYWHNFSQTISHHHHHHHHQVLVYQPGISSTRQSYFPQNIISTDQQMNFHNSPVQSANATTHFNISTANLLPSHNNEGRS